MKYYEDDPEKKLLELIAQPGEQAPEMNANAVGNANLANAISKLSASFGSIGGKTPQAGGLDDYAKGVAQEEAMNYQNKLGGFKMREDDKARRAKLYEGLIAKRDREKEKVDDRQFKLDMAEATNANRQAQADMRHGEAASNKAMALADKMQSFRESHPVTKRTNEIYSSYSNMKSAASNPSPAADMKLIFNFMKMQDPGSTVREGEYANAANAGAVPDRVREIYNKIITGQKLTPQQRQDFMNQAVMDWDNQRKTQLNFDLQLKTKANKRGVNPDDVIFDVYDLEGKEQEAPKGPSPSAVAPKPEVTTQPVSNPMSDQDQAALLWTEQNPNDPRAAAIRAKLKERGILK